MRIVQKSNLVVTNGGKSLLQQDAVISDVLTIASDDGKSVNVYNGFKKMKKILFVRKKTTSKQCYLHLRRL